MLSNDSIKTEKEDIVCLQITGALELVLSLEGSQLTSGINLDSPWKVVSPSCFRKGLQLAVGGKKTSGIDSRPLLCVISRAFPVSACLSWWSWVPFRGHVSSPPGSEESDTAWSTYCTWNLVPGISRRQGWTWLCGPSNLQTLRQPLKEKQYMFTDTKIKCMVLEGAW